MVKKYLLFLFMILLLGMLAGCGDSAGSGYEGKWIAIVKNDWDGTKLITTLDIKKNGENYIINTASEGYKDIGKTVGEMGKTVTWTKFPGKTISATLKDGKLIVDPTLSFTYIKNDVTILGSRGEIYIKESPTELEKLKQEVTDHFKQKKPKMNIKTE